MTNGTTQATQTGFYRGLQVWHGDEIELAVELEAAIRLTIGNAAAQALDDAGFAIAESLAVAMLFEAEGDDDIVYTTKVVWRGGRKPFKHDATPAY